MIDNMMNSCLMLAMNFECPVSMGAIFEDSDLADTGLELDPHITLLYAQGKTLPKKLILPKLQELNPSEMAELEKLCKAGKEESRPVLDMFNLDVFENSTDYVILKLKSNTKLYRILKTLNKTLRDVFKIVSDYEYTPHLTLAEVESGKGIKYLNSEGLMNILRESFISPDDITLSFGVTGEKEDRKQYFLTQYNVLDRFFKLDQEVKFNKALREN